MSYELAVFFKDCYPKRGQRGKDHLRGRGPQSVQDAVEPGTRAEDTHLGENEHFVVPNRVQGIPVGRLGSVLPLCVRRKSKDVHLHVHAHFFVRQELARDHLNDGRSTFSGARR